MAYNGFAIDKYLNAAEVTRQLDELIKKPVYSVRPDKLKMYEEEYFEKKCSKSKAMITEAKKVIPGGVQHNLAFNYPFPIVIEKAEGARLYDICLLYTSLFLPQPITADGKLSCGIYLIFFPALPVPQKSLQNLPAFLIQSV